MMYGDTLIEAWRGTILGEPSPRVQGCSEIYHSHFGHKYNSVAFGIAGKLASLHHSKRCHKHLLLILFQAIPLSTIVSVLENT